MCRNQEPQQWAVATTRLPLISEMEVSLMAALKNARHEKYVQNLIAGMSQRQAYRDAFPGSKKWKDKTVDNKASELFSGEVLGRYNEIQEEQKKDALLTRWEKRKILADIARDEENAPSDRTRAIDTDNKMENEYINRVELSKPVDDTIKELEEYFDG